RLIGRFARGSRGGARVGARSDRESGPAVRKAGRGAQARARSIAVAAGPGALHAATADAVAARTARSRGEPVGRRFGENRAIRPLPLAGRCPGGNWRRPRILDRAVRSGERGADGGADRGVLRRGGGRSGGGPRGAVAALR